MRLRSPQSQDSGMTLLLHTFPAVSRARLLVQTHKHDDRMEELALRHKWLLWLIHRKHGDGKYWCRGRKLLSLTGFVCVFKHM